MQAKVKKQGRPKQTRVLGKRRRARELALQALYQVDFHRGNDNDSVREFWRTQQVSAEVSSFAHFLVDGVQARHKEIDDIIEKYSEHWRIHRMSRVDRNIIRVAVFEFLACTDVPTKVVIDEAIEIGKKFGSSESGAFINGVLDPISKNIKR